MTPEESNICSKNSFQKKFATPLGVEHAVCNVSTPNGVVEIIGIFLFYKY